MDAVIQTQKQLPIASVIRKRQRQCGLNLITDDFHVKEALRIAQIILPIFLEICRIHPLQNNSKFNQKTNNFN